MECDLGDWRRPKWPWTICRKCCWKTKEFPRQMSLTLPSHSQRQQAFPHFIWEAERHRELAKALTRTAVTDSFDDCGKLWWLWCESCWAPLVWSCLIPARKPILTDGRTDLGMIDPEWPDDDWREEDPRVPGRIPRGERHPTEALV